MVSKSMAEQLNGGMNNFRRLGFIGGGINENIRPLICEQDDELTEENQQHHFREQFSPSSILSMRGGRGGGVCSTNNSIYMRGGIGPGRRVLKLGVGGFTVRHTKSAAGGGINSRSQSFGGSSAGFSPQLEDEQGQIEDDKSLALLNAGVTLGGKPRMRRPRKSRRPQLEDAYPANIQESFFGVAAVESRLLAEQNVEEPLLVEYNKISSNVFDAGKIGTELSEHSAELLRNEQEMDMLDDIPLVDDIGLDMESLDFTDLLVNEEEDVAISSAIAAENIDSLDGFNAGSSSSLLTNNAVEICSPPSASTIRTQSRMQQNNSIESCVTQNASNIYQTVKESTPKLIEYQRLSAGALAVERWEEDEPLGDKATKAAVLYSNIQHPNLKEKFPLWSDRVRQINKIWRELNPEKRQEFVELARKNRLNCPTPRRRSRRVVINPATQQQLSLEHNTSEISQTGDTSIKIKEEGSLDVAFREELSMTDQLSNQSTGGSCSYSNTTFIGLDKTSEDKQHPQTIQQQSSSIDSQQLYFDEQGLKLKEELRIEEEKIEKMKKTKRALAAKQRLLIKRQQSQQQEGGGGAGTGGACSSTTTIPSSPQLSSEELTALPLPPRRGTCDLVEVEANLLATKNCIQEQQKLVDAGRQKLKMYLGKQQQQMKNILINKQLEQQHQIFLPPSTSSPQYYSKYLIQQQSSSTSINNLYDIEGQQQYFNKNSGSFDQSLTASFQPIKPTRGRKRKKPPHEHIRSQILGKIVYSTLQTQEDRDVYDVIDGLVHTVSSNFNSANKAADALFIKRILFSHQQQEQNLNLATRSSRDGGESCRGKKRSLNKQNKCQETTTEVKNDFMRCQDRIKEALDSLPPLITTLEQYKEYDRHILKYPNQIGMPDNPGYAEFSNKNVKVGEYKLDFMIDFYDELETNRGDFIEEEFFFAPTMDEICQFVDLDMLESFDDDSLSTIPSGSFEIKFGTDFADKIREMSFIDWTNLSIENIADKGKLIRSALLPGGSGPEVDVPIDPHWSRFEKEEVNPLEREVEVIIDYDPTITLREDMLKKLQKLLGIGEISAVELETPPQTPASPPQQQQTQLITNSNNLLSGNVENIRNVNLNEKNSLIICKKCENVLTPEKRPIEEFAVNLGLSNEKSAIITFCSMPCYFTFLADKRIPLTVELLGMAERCVNEETLEILRQASVDNFAKKINNGGGDQQGGGGGGTEENCGELLDLNLPRELRLKCSELATLIQAEKDKKEKNLMNKKIFKWRGHGWTRCDVELINSFNKQQEEIKKKIDSIYLRTANKKYEILRNEDTRFCAFCGELGDGDQELTGRLLNLDANEWVHVNCALWSAEVHVTEEGALINVDVALRKAQKVDCKICNKKGASIRCYKLDCINKDFAFHLRCAKKCNGHFLKDKTFFCPNHEIRQDFFNCSF
uniref:PHD-type domain-containing protein n=1 Tax=Meloidogyne enterolobii TaxID=390850 RepID=A0A6V7YBL5_MELEN|nr:unnamed protein product [Meloidogyne enterolobii]